MPAAAAQARPTPKRRLTARDIEIIKTVYEWRSVTSTHIQRLFFDPDSPYYQPPRNPNRPAPEASEGSPNSRCQARLQFLKEEGYLARRSLVMNIRVDHTKPRDPDAEENEGPPPYIYFLNTRGATLLYDEFPHLYPRGIDWRKRQNKIKWAGLSHRLATCDVRLAFVLAVRRRGLVLGPWLDERALGRQEHGVVVKGTHPGDDKEETIYPDGFFVIYDPNDNNYPYYRFLEADMGTETADSDSTSVRDFRRKIRTYLAYQKSGTFAQQVGDRANSFVVFVAVPDERRKQQLIHLCRQNDAIRMFYFATYQKIVSGDPIEKGFWDQPLSNDPMGLAP